MLVLELSGVTHLFLSKLHSTIGIVFVKDTTGRLVVVFKVSVNGGDNIDFVDCAELVGPKRPKTDVNNPDISISDVFFSVFELVVGLELGPKSDDNNPDISIFGVLSAPADGGFKIDAIDEIVVNTLDKSFAGLTVGVSTGLFFCSEHGVLNIGQVEAILHLVVIGVHDIGLLDSYIDENRGHGALNVLSNP